MIRRILVSKLLYAVLYLALNGCAANTDYTNFLQHRPRSILVLPPLNESTAVEATYGYLSTVTMPLAEMGYYVFPIVLVDHFLKENGMPTAGEMHEVQLEKFAEIFGADAVLFITVEEYGTKYYVITSITKVRAKATLIDTRTGIKIWEGVGEMAVNSGGSGNMIADLILAVAHQIGKTSTDYAHFLSGPANLKLLTTEGRGLLHGPYHPNYEASQ
jgi:hypothetical protein